MEIQVIKKPNRPGRGGARLVGMPNSNRIVHRASASVSDSVRPATVEPTPIVAQVDENPKSQNKHSMRAHDNDNEDEDDLVLLLDVPVSREETQQATTSTGDENRDSDNCDEETLITTTVENSKHFRTTESTNKKKGAPGPVPETVEASCDDTVAELTSSLSKVEIATPLTGVVSRCCEAKAVLIRTACVDDAVALYQLHAAFKREMATWEDAEQMESADIDELEELLATEGGRVTLLTRKLDCSEEVLGFCYAYPETRKTTQQRSLYVAEVYISPPVRGFGFAEIMLAHTIGLALAPAAHLMVCSRNKGAVALYLKLGFVKSKQKTGDKVHDLLMELPDVHEACLEDGPIATILLRRLEGNSRGRRRTTTSASSASSSSAPLAKDASKSTKKNTKKADCTTTTPVVAKNKSRARLMMERSPSAHTLSPATIGTRRAGNKGKVLCIMPSPEQTRTTRASATAAAAKTVKAVGKGSAVGKSRGATRRFGTQLTNRAGI